MLLAGGRGGGGGTVGLEKRRRESCTWTVEGLKGPERFSDQSIRLCSFTTRFLYFPISFTFLFYFLRFSLYLSSQAIFLIFALFGDFLFCLALFPVAFSSFFLNFCLFSSILLRAFDLGGPT